MSDQFFELRLLRYALASAEHGSFRRAALALGVQQSSVSKAVGNLEHIIGMPLFERNHAGVRPTLTGERFLWEASLGFDHLKRAMHDIGAAQRGEQRKIAIASSVPFVLLGDLLERFRDEHESLSVEMIEATCVSSVTLVQQRKADIAFVSKTTSDRTLQSLHLRDEQMIAVLPKSHHLADALAMTPEELREERFILSTGGLGPEIAAHLSRHLAKSRYEPALQLHSIGQSDLIDMVARGFGVTIIVGRPLQIASDQVALIPLAGISVMPISAVWMDGNSDLALRQLQSVARRFIPNQGSSAPS